jgi:hypothetical protein
MKRLVIVLFWSVAAVTQAKQTKELKPLPNLAETIEWLTGASQEEAGWGGGSFQFSSDGKCNAEISTGEGVEISSGESHKYMHRQRKYSFRLTTTCTR